MYCLAISGNGKILAVAGEDGRIFTWSSNGSAMSFWSITCSASVEKLLFVPGDMQLLAFSNEGSILAWYPGEHAPRKHVTSAHGKGIYAACFGNGGSELFTGGLDSWIRGWGPSTFDLLHEIKSPKHGVLSLLPFNENGNQFLISGNVNGTIAIFNIEECELVQSMSAHDGPVFCLEPVGNQFFISTGNDDFIRIWQNGDDRPLIEILASQGKVLDAMMLDGNTFVTAGGDGTIVTWKFDVASLACYQIARLAAHERTVEQFVLDPAGGAFYSLASDGCVKRWAI